MKLFIGYPILSLAILNTAFSLELNFLRSNLFSRSLALESYHYPGSNLDLYSRHFLESRAKKGKGKGSSDPPPPKYGKFQTDGEAYATYLNDPTLACTKVGQSQVDYDSLENDGWEFESKAVGAPFNVLPMAKKVGLDISKVWTEMTAMKDAAEGDDANAHINLVGPGAIFALSNIRIDSNPWSEVAGACYGKSGSGDLNYVFRVDVINTQTLLLVRDQIYPENSLNWPTEDFREWQPGSAEFNALLGTPNGKGVAALLLGHREQYGNRKVTKITTWAGGNDEKLQILFTIGNA
jgi:hypothetical protein